MRKAAHRVSRVWILLVLLTLLNMLTGHAGSADLVGSAFVLAAAIAKGHWMVMDFLKLRHVTPGWRALFISWLVTVSAAAWTAAAAPFLRG